MNQCFPKPGQLCGSTDRSILRTFPHPFEPSAPYGIMIGAIMNHLSLDLKER